MENLAEDPQVQTGIPTMAQHGGHIIPTGAVPPGPPQQAATMGTKQRTAAPGMVPPSAPHQAVASVLPPAPLA